ncbi:Alpha/Beta hydrolase protein [Lactarius akahatsu]|uniref:Alpha/Beta hydrolase protein n=1 Tax=Lactarius akahatsu TaxID=416441 RepID=A0AAD4Q4W3_9AGAM|nr:Alpha/Beta hydrolase protein [Lactarius akahatsu]
MSQRIARKVCARRQPSLLSFRNNKVANPPFSIANPLRTIAAGLSLQPSHDAPSGWLALSAFVGLPLALWAYKVCLGGTIGGPRAIVLSRNVRHSQCLMLIIFQRKVIYMGRYAPPGSRTELLADMYPKYTPNGIHIEELSIPSSRPSKVRLSALLLRRDLSAAPQHVIVYLQGNAGNPLHRIPMFATLLNAIPSLAILAPAPRSYWTSTGARPTQAGLTADHAAALAFAASRFPTSRLTLYGHSLGASAALCLLGNDCAPGIGVHGLVLENAFTSVPDMLRALYPQRWLPYRYLGPFVVDRWDARAAARGIRRRALAHRAMVLVSERDEVVPPVMGQEIFDALKVPSGTDGRIGRLVVLERALHEDAWRHRDWSQAMKQYLCDLEGKL